MKHNSIIKLSLGMLLAFLMVLPAIAQDSKTYSGVVVDENDVPIIGAAVRVLGTTTGTVTDLDGNFSVKLPSEKSEVEISYIGYLTQKITNFKQTKVIMKEDTQKLDEVVVVGYGTQKKAHLTGAISTVPMDEIQDLSSDNLASMLSGLVPGLSVSGGNARPGERATIYIRNSDNISDIGSTAQEPLFVIDGYIYPNDVKIGNSTENLGATAFSNLDASMIESISVLKDASAAVYGARAANGVILVTTKHGKLGEPKFTYSASIGITDEVKRTKMLNSYQYGRLYNSAVAANARANNSTLNNRTDLFQADELNAMKSLNYDLLDKYWDTGVTQKHSINASGATERANYFAGISYYTQDGNLGKLDYERWNYRAGVDLKISKWLKANLSITGDYGEKLTPNVKVGGSGTERDYNMLLNRLPYVPEYVNGYPIAAYGVSNELVSDDQTYSFAELQSSGDYSKTMTSNMTINGSLEYDFGWIKPLKGLTMRFNYSKSISESKNNQYGSEYNIYTLSERSGSGNHLYTPIAGQEEAYEALMTEGNFILANGGAAVSNGDYLSRNNSRTDNYQMNFNVIYNRDFGLHHVGALFSIEKSETESEYLYGYKTDPYEFTTGQSNSATGEETTTFTRAESGTLSYLGRINYAYANKYLFEFLFRSDASTKFSPDNYWGYFPSVSMGWVMSEEDWFKKSVGWIDYLKIRGSFGLTGRDNTSAWQWMQVYAMDADKGPVFGTSLTSTSGSRITINKNNSAVNSDAHWDKVYKANFGIDLNVLQNRLSFTFDAYYEWNREMLLPYSASIPGTVGTQSANVNYGKMDNYGFELSATWRSKIGKDFKYKININTGYTDNEVLSMDWETEYLYRQITKGHRSDAGVWGMSCLGMFRSYQEIDEYFEKYNITSYLGMTKDQVQPGMLIYKDVRGALQSDGTYAGPDGVVDADNDQVRLSTRTSNPYSFTANLSAEYKNFSISAQLSASWGAYSFISTSALKGYSTLEYSNMPSFWNPDNMFAYETVYDAAGNVVVEENRNAKYPNLAFSTVNSLTSSFWRVNGTRVTLKNMTIAYKVPTKLVQRIGIESCRFNLTGQNLLSLYNPYPDNFMDPMSSYSNYPTLRKFTLGINITF